MTTTTGWALGGTDLRTLAHNVTTVDGWDSWPGKRGIGVNVPYRHGAVTDPRKYYQAREFAISVSIAPTNASGTVSHPEGAHGHIRDNLDDLLGLLHSPDSLLSVIRTEPKPGGGTHQREALCEVINAIPITRNLGPLDRIMVIQFMMPKPFWRELPKVIDSSNVGSFTIATGGNAPIDDPLITFRNYNGVARLTVDSTGDYLEIDANTTASNWVTVDVGARTVTQNFASADNVITFNRPWWMELPPNKGTLGLTLTNGIVDLEWYNKWF